jgi:hypothetical protein
MLLRVEAHTIKRVSVKHLQPLSVHAWPCVQPFLQFECMDQLSQLQGLVSASLERFQNVAMPTRHPATQFRMRSCDLRPARLLLCEGWQTQKQTCQYTRQVGTAALTPSPNKSPQVEVCQQVQECQGHNNIDLGDIDDLRSVPERLRSCPLRRDNTGGVSV